MERDFHILLCSLLSCLNSGKQMCISFMVEKKGGGREEGNKGEKEEGERERWRGRLEREGSSS